MAQTIWKRIYSASLKLLLPQTPEETYATIVNEALKLSKAAYGSILLEQEGELRRVYASHPLLFQFKHRKRGYLYGTFKTKKPIILHSKDIEKIHPLIKKLSIKWDLIMPLSYRNKAIGSLTVLTKQKERFSDEVVNSLILFSSMASLAIYKAQLFNETKKALESRDLFLSMASHELKTPVTTIFGYSQLLINNKIQKKEIKTEWIEALHAECFRLKSLVHDLLEINRIHTGLLHYNLKECSLRKIIERSLDNLKFSYSDRQVILEDKIKDTEPLLIGDFDKLIQVFINILDNAAKFSPPDSKIFLSLKSDNSNYVIRIKDQGRGVSKKDMPRLFERFYKGAGTAHEGLGLGLFLVKSIVEYHRGTVDLKTRLNNGTIIEIRLPKIKL